MNDITMIKNKAGFFEKVVLFLAPVGVIISGVNALSAFETSSWFMFVFHLLVFSLFIAQSKKLWGIVKDYG